jgi:hypothetical protein
MQLYFLLKDSQSNVLYTESLRSLNSYCSLTVDFMYSGKVRGGNGSHSWGFSTVGRLISCCSSTWDSDHPPGWTDVSHSGMTPGSPLCNRKSRVKNEVPGVWSALRMHTMIMRILKQTFQFDVDPTFNLEADPESILLFMHKFFMALSWPSTHGFVYHICILSKFIPTFMKSDLGFSGFWSGRVADPDLTRKCGSYTYIVQKLQRHMLVRQSSHQRVSST